MTTPTADRRRWPRTLGAAAFALLLPACGARTELRDAVPDAAPSPGELTVSAGRYHACALRPTGGAVCWGSNAAGQLGVGGAQSGQRTEVVGLSGAARLASHMDTTCAVLRDGRVRCWGDAAAAGLVRENPRRMAPTEVPSLAGVRELAMGRRVQVALLGDGTARTWGENDNGGLGINADTMPAGVQTPLGLGPVAAVGGGYEQLCAVLRDGGVWCWGPRLTDYAGRVSVLVPRQVYGVEGARSVALTVGSVCAVLSDRTLRCWGYNREGALGDGTTTDRPLPQPVAGITDVASLSGGFGHFCAVDRDGAVWCWGRNADGECGAPLAAQVTAPTRVPGLPPARSVSAGFALTCAVTTDDRVYCWGANDARQLGSGVGRRSAVPVRVEL